MDSEQSIEALHWTYSADPLFVVEASLDGRFVYLAINPAFESHLGRSSRHIHGMDVLECLAPDDARRVCEAFRACLAEGAEIRIRHRLALGGLPRSVETVVSPAMQPRPDAIIRLIGGHRALRHRGGGLDMNLDLISIQESIQQRIASDLHDSTCQHLIAASLGLMRIRNSVGESARAVQFCDDIDASLDEAMREIRAFAYLLHPRHLTDEGLAVAIERYAEGFARRTALRVDVKIVPDVDRLPYETKRTLLRVIQEALTNVFRHASATEVAIAIGLANGRFHLTVSDNGRGLPPGFGGRGVSIGVGIPAMQARLQEIGGQLDIQPNRRSAHGTVLCAVFPDAPAANRAHGRRAATTRGVRAGAQSTREH